MDKMKMLEMLKGMKSPKDETGSGPCPECGADQCSCGESSDELDMMNPEEMDKLIKMSDDELKPLGFMHDPSNPKAIIKIEVISKDKAGPDLLSKLLGE